jgi:UDP-N-acetylmuramate--alanine ligase
MTRLNDYRHIYFLGIGGIGMSALARYCLRWGIQVSGYDRQTSSITDELIASGAQIHFDDQPGSVKEKPDIVIYTPAIHDDHKLWRYFNSISVPMIKRSQALEIITRDVETIAVAGTHGKTTTSSMISFLLTATGRKHTALLGGIAANYRSNFYSESPDLMVVEADEYDRSFLRLQPAYAVVTAMDADHLDIYGSEENMIEGYRQFIRQIRPGGLFIYRHDLKEVIRDEVWDEMEEKQVKVISYGIAAGDYHRSSSHVDRGIWIWDLSTPNGVIKNLELHMPGAHNVLNAVAASAIVLELGAEEIALQRVWPDYRGVSRRFEIRYQDDEHVLIDDYAHHPEELKAAIQAARETFGGPVTGVFQPHLYSRTRDLADGFAAALDTLDIPVLIDIYPAREEPIPGVSSQIILDRMRNPNKKWISGESWVPWIIAQQPGVLITLGAGDLDKHIPELIRKLYKKE